MLYADGCTIFPTGIWGCTTPRKPISNETSSNMEIQHSLTIMQRCSRHRQVHRHPPPYPRAPHTRRPCCSCCQGPSRRTASHAGATAPTRPVKANGLPAIPRYTTSTLYTQLRVSLIIIILIHWLFSIGILTCGCK